MTAGFAPTGEVFAVVEEQVVALFADATHRAPQRDACWRWMVMCNNAGF
jgi:hypothetical protein